MGNINAEEAPPREDFSGVTFKREFEPTYTVSSLKEIKEIL
ncbi:MAG: hypothetical protein ACOX19_01580 [Fermentimonas sp.]|jgi:hypothetical protein